MNGPRRATLRWALGGLALLLVSVGALGAAWQAVLSNRERSTTPPGKLVDIGGYRLHLWCMGTGSPTVILESGLSGGAFEWGYVQPVVARQQRVCSYDRAGLGYSDPGPRPRTTKQMVRELGALLDSAGIDDQLVLVGQSYGGFNVRVFATQHPARVAGIVLADTSHEDQRRRFADAKAPTGEVPAMLPYVMPVAAALGIPRLVGFGAGLETWAIDPHLRHFVDATRCRRSA